MLFSALAPLALALGQPRNTRSIRAAGMKSDDEFTRFAASASLPSAVAVRPRRDFHVIAGLFGGGLVLGSAAGAVLNFI